MTTAIILQAFGSSNPAHRQVRDQVMTAYSAAFPDCQVLISLASERVRRLEGLPSLPEQLATLAGNGVTRVVVQHLLLVAGQMYAEALSAEALSAHPLLHMVHGAPLLADAVDRAWFIDHLATQIHPHLPTIAVVHGNTRNPQHNAYHLALQEEAAGRGLNVVFASLEGEPGPEPIQRLLPQARRAGGAHLIPLFVFPGGHVLDDLLGPSPDSWASVLGVPLTHSPTLLEQQPVIERFLQHTRAAMAATD